MTEQDRKAFDAALMGLAVIFDKTLSDQILDAYFSALARFDWERVNRGLNAALTACKFFPKPVELIELIEGSQDDHSAKAWQLLMEALEKGGYYNSLFVEDQALAAAIRKTFTGWMDLANEIPSPSDSMYASLFNRFRANYGMAKRSNEQVDRYFVGYHEGQNRQNVSQWEQIGEGDSEPTFLLKVVVIAGGKVFETKLQFSRLTGALTEGARQQLTAGIAQPVTVSVPALPPARMIEGEAKPEEVRRAIAALAGRKRLKPWPDEDVVKPLNSESDFDAVIAKHAAELIGQQEAA
jgi:hypothetical protein